MAAWQGCDLARMENFLVFTKTCLYEDEKIITLVSV